MRFVWQLTDIPYAKKSLRTLLCSKHGRDQHWRSKAKYRPGPTIKVPPFQPLKFAYKNFKWKKIMFRAYSKI